MTASTKGRWLTALLLAVALALIAPPAWSAKPVIAIAPLEYMVPNVGRGLAAVLAEELAASGIAQVKPLAEKCCTGHCGATCQLHDGSVDYLLSGAVTAFTVADKDVALDLGRSFSDLSALLGGGNRIAQVVLELRLARVDDDAEVAAATLEGRESQRGLRIQTVTLGWAGTVAIDSDEFRQSNLGRAAYKAIGETLRWLAAALPPAGCILAVSGEAVVIDLGSSSGLSIGDELTVYRESGVPNNLGQCVWDSATRVAAVQVVEVRTDRSLCLVLDGLGAIAEGDTVHPLQRRLLLPLETDTR